MVVSIVVSSESLQKKKNAEEKETNTTLIFPSSFPWQICSILLQRERERERERERKREREREKVYNFECDWLRIDLWQVPFPWNLYFNNCAMGYFILKYWTSKIILRYFSDLLTRVSTCPVPPHTRMSRAWTSPPPARGTSPPRNESHSGNFTSGTFVKWLYFVLQLKKLL